MADDHRFAEIERAEREMAEELHIRKHAAGVLEEARRQFEHAAKVNAEAQRFDTIVQAEYEMTEELATRRRRAEVDANTRKAAQERAERIARAEVGRLKEVDRLATRHLPLIEKQEAASAAKIKGAKQAKPKVREPEDEEKESQP